MLEAVLQRERGELCRPSPEPTRNPGEFAFIVVGVMETTGEQMNYAAALFGTRARPPRMKQYPHVAPNPVYIFHKPPDRC